MSPHAVHTRAVNHADQNISRVSLPVVTDLNLLLLKNFTRTTTGGGGGHAPMSLLLGYAIGCVAE